MHCTEEAKRPDYKKTPEWIYGQHWRTVAGAPAVGPSGPGIDPLDDASTDVMAVEWATLVIGLPPE